jgi:2-methylcitrate dehydratase PrpD
VPDAAKPAAPVTASLARFVAGLHWEAVPDEVRHAARRSLLNVIACALGGHGDPAVRAFSGALRPLAGPPIATEIGVGRTDPATAAFLNAAAANVQDFDDQHLPTVMHPGPVIVSAALAAAEMVEADGRGLLEGIAAGLEAGCRIGNAVTPGHYAAGFHITATCGVFGAAAAAARVMKLDEDATRHALAHGASQSAGLVEALGAATKSTGVGAAARTVLHAALFARAGITGPAAPLEGRFGFLRVMAADPVPGRITDGLGVSWEMLRSTPKAYPVGVVLHPVVDAALELREMPGCGPADLAGIELSGHPLLRLRADRPEVATGREATVSAQHVCAIAVLRGTVGPSELTDAAVADPAVRALRSRVRVSESPKLPVEAVKLVAARRDGSLVSVSISVGRGLPGRPLTDGELLAKVDRLLAFGAPWCSAARLVTFVQEAEVTHHVGSRLQDLLPRPDPGEGVA